MGTTAALLLAVQLAVPTQDPTNAPLRDSATDSRGATQELRVQDGARIALLGLCSRPDGSPWADAEVHCYTTRLGHLGPAQPRPGDLDEVLATSDARGKFRVLLLPGHSYSVWARSKDGAETPILASGVVEGVFAGVGRVRLQGSPAPRARACRVTSPDASRDVRGARFRIIWRIQNHRVRDLPFGPSGDLVLPGLPRIPVRLECTSRDGFLLGLRDFTPRELAEEAVHWQLEERATHEVRVVDGADRPIKAAAVHVRPLLAHEAALPSPIEPWNHERKWWPVASTDASGVASFVAPTGNIESVLILAEGYRAAIHRLSSKEPVRLVEEPVHRVRLVSGDSPLAGARVLALSNDPIPTKIGDLELMQTVDRQPELRETDADGYVDLRGSPNVRLELVLDEERSQLLGSRAGGRRTILLGSVSTRARAANVFDVATLTERRVRVLAADGMPVPYPSLCVLADGKDGHEPSVLYRGNRRGVVELGLPPGGYSVLAIVPGTGWGESRLEEDEESSELRLAPFRTIPVEVLTAAETPAANARVTVSGTWWQRQERFFRQAADWNAAALTLECDARGRGSADLIPWPGLVFSVSASDRQGRRRLRGRNNLSTDALPDRLQLTLR